MRGSRRASARNKRLVRVNSSTLPLCYDDDNCNNSDDDDDEGYNEREDDMQEDDKTTTAAAATAMTDVVVEYSLSNDKARSFENCYDDRCMHHKKTSCLEQMESTRMSEELS